MAVQQQPMSHQLMGYDRAITMFSPDGRLLQVEYAKKTIKQGSTAIGIACADGVVLVSDKRIVDKLVVPESVEKTFQIDDHIGATAAGIISDARVLVERAQMKAQQHKVTYDTPIDTLTIVKDICSLKQVCTQSGGLRPFGVGLLVAGVDDDGSKLYATDPTGIYFEYKATAMGEFETEINEMLTKEYKPSITVDEAIKFSISALKKLLADTFNFDRIDVAYISTSDKMFVKMGKKDIEKLFSQSKKK